MSVPDKLFKYKTFSPDSMELILADYLYFANPSKFNDPLDCKVSIDDDINDESQLRSILSNLYKINAERKLNDSARSLRYKGPKTLEKISTLSQSEAERLVSEIYDNFDFFDDKSASINQALANSIGNVILSGYSKGILSLAENSDCPLMWAHYANNHEGLCLGYKIPDKVKAKIHPINYSSNRREIKTSQIIKMLNNDNTARREIEDAIFLRKATPWGYEKEWRMISNVGLQNATIYLSEIIFGLRCKDTTMYSVMKSLQGRSIEVKFYKMVEVSKSFTLAKEEITFGDEYIQELPRCLEHIDEMLSREW